MKFSKRILLTTIGLLTLLFIWQEWNDFNLKEKINHDKVGNYFTALGAILTGYSLILIAKQVALQREANDAANRPEIVMVHYGTAKSPSASDYDGRPISVTLKNENNEMANFTLKNTGTGTAYDINIDYSFDQKEVLNFFKDKFDVTGFMNLSTHAHLPFIESGKTNGVIFPHFFHFAFTDKTPDTLPVSVVKIPSLTCKISYKNSSSSHLFSKQFLIRGDKFSGVAIFTIQEQISK